jgi:hypothetical protein
MIEVKVYEWGFEVIGHANADKMGKDIVCAAVSAIAYTAAGAMEELCGSCDHEEHEGYMLCKIPDTMSGRYRKGARLILGAAIIGFRQIENTYPDYVRVVEGGDKSDG